MVNIYSYFIKLNSTVTWEGDFKSGLVLSIGFALTMSLILWGLEKLCIHKKHKFGHQITLQFLFTLITLNIIPLFILSTKGLNNTLEVVVPLALSFTLLSFLRCAYIYFNHYSENLIKQKDVELSHLKELQAATELSHYTLK